jgi:glycosyltransferase involved in cell wall biosynthesis
MREPTVPKTAAADYVFHFDVPLKRISFNKHTKITGWLLHRQGLPTYGIRGIVRRALRRRSVFKARRKRSRPLIAAAYPDFPEAGESGFLLELELPFGRSDVTIQVRDHEKTWQTILVTQIWAFPLSFLGRTGLPRVEHVLVTSLTDLFPGKTQSITASAVPGLVARAEINPHYGRIKTFTGAPGPTHREIKTVHLFVTSKSNLFIREIAELLCAGFRDAGCDAQLLVDQIPVERTESGKIQIVVTPHEFFNLFLAYQLPLEKIQCLTNHLFLLGTEQPESEWFYSNLVMAPYARAMLDIHLSGVTGYRASGVPCFHLPLGYHPLLEQGDASTNPERDVDVCVLAAMTDRREEFIAANADWFAARNCHLRLVPLGFAKTETTRSYLPVARRNSLLRRTKILLNVHYSELPYFEWHRALIGLANRCFIVTEPCEGFAPLIPGKHLIVARAEHLTTCCEYYLEHEDERKAIVGAAYDFVRDRLTQKDSCRAFLEQVQNVFTGGNATAHYAFSMGANAETKSKTEPLPDALTKRISRKPFGLLLSALGDDLLNMLRRTNQKSAATGRKPLRDAAQGIALLSDMRHGYTERLDSQKRARQNGEPVFRLLDNQCFDRSTPAISVVVTLYNYAAYIPECLKSLEESNTATIPGGIEVVIVNDASSDDSLAKAISALQTSRHPVRIIDKRFNTGLADARNIGLEVARAPYAFILDADNMVLPRALEQLYNKIVTENSAAVYSMLCRFEGDYTHRDGLLSYFDWDPQMLVERPYIDAMALFDRRQLIEIGGYDTQLYKFGWFGWEDYELWLRIARANLRVSFLPNVLCLYRHHETSMSITTNFFDRELVAHLYEKYHALVEAYPPKNRILGVTRSRFEEASRTASEQRKRTDVACATPYPPPPTDAREARSRSVSETDVHSARKPSRERNREAGVRGDQVRVKKL